MKQKAAAEGRGLQEGEGWRDGPGVAASGMERRRHTGVLKGEGTGEGVLPRWGLGEVVLSLRNSGGQASVERIPWMFGPGLLCHTHSLSLISE